MKEENSVYPPSLLDNIKMEVYEVLQNTLIPMYKAHEGQPMKEQQTPPLQHKSPSNLPPRSASSSSSSSSSNFFKKKKSSTPKITSPDRGISQAHSLTNVQPSPSPLTADRSKTSPSRSRPSPPGSRSKSPAPHSSSPASPISSPRSPSSREPTPPSLLDQPTVECSRCGMEYTEERSCSRCNMHFCLPCSALSSMKNPCEAGGAHSFTINWVEARKKGEEEGKDNEFFGSSIEWNKYK